MILEFYRKGNKSKVEMVGVIVRHYIYDFKCTVIHNNERTPNQTIWQLEEL